jgi:hypothetical protein
LSLYTPGSIVTRATACSSDSCESLVRFSIRYSHLTHTESSPMKQLPLSPYRAWNEYAVHLRMRVTQEHKFENVIQLAMESNRRSQALRLREFVLTKAEMRPSSRE